jgi:hypothetical protein
MFAEAKLPEFSDESLPDLNPLACSFPRNIPQQRA